MIFVCLFKWDIITFSYVIMDKFNFSVPPFFFFLMQTGNNRSIYKFIVKVNWVLYVKRLKWCLEDSKSVVVAIFIALLFYVELIFARRR